MSNYYCEYCGSKHSTVSSLVANTCIRNPSKGRHKLYEGSEKSQYVCKYCGMKYTNIASLTANTCSKHPNGASKGRHAPAL